MHASTSRYLFISLVAVSALLLGEHGLAATENSVAEEDKWETWVAPYLWGLSLSGDAQVGDKTGDVDVSFSDILDDINIGAMGFVDGRKGRVGYFINPIYSRLTAKENTDDEQIDVTADTAILALGGYYRWIDTNVRGRNGGDTGRLVVEPYAGVRWTYLRAKVDVDGEGQGDESENWLDPIVGSRLMYVWDPRWDIAFAADVGGFGIGSDSAWNIHLLMGYRLQLFGREAIIRGGYRALHQDYETGSGRSTFKWDVTQKGPIAGIALKF